MMNITSRIRFAAYFLVLVWGAPATHASDLRETVERLQTETGIEGLSVAVINAAGELQVATAGIRQPGAAVTSETAFEIGSVSKVMTAALVLIAEQKGRLSLSSQLSDWYPEVPRSEVITMQQMLQHTAGLRDPLLEQTFVMKYFMSPATAPNAEELLASIDDTDFEPGSAWKYSNPGFIAAALILERVTQKSFQQLLREELLVPTGVDHVASISWPQDPERPLAHGFRDLSGSGRFVDMSAFSNSRPFLEATQGAGSLIATAPALARLLRDILAGPILNEGQRKRMLSWTDRPDGHRYGLGVLRIEDERGRELLGHRGNTAAFSTEAWHLPAENVTIAVLSNRGGILVDNVTAAVLDQTLELQPN